jgi:AmiR/NasT family two-component response regulator
MQADPPRVLIGNLKPIMRLGLVAVLTEAGMDVVAQEQQAHMIINKAARLLPAAVVLDRDDELSRTLSERVLKAAPRTKVVFWARDETFIEVLDPATGTTRIVNPSILEDLRSELAGGRSEQLMEE